MTDTQSNGVQPSGDQTRDYKSLLNAPEFQQIINYFRFNKEKLMAQYNKPGQKGELLGRCLSNCNAYYILMEEYEKTQTNSMAMSVHRSLCKLHFLFTELRQEILERRSEDESTNLLKNLKI